MSDAPNFTPNVMRYGREEPLPERRELRAGPLTAVLEHGDLRLVRLGDEVVVLRLYGAVRDRNWDTIEPRFTRYEVEEGAGGFEVRYTAQCFGGEVDFAWEGRLSGTPEGVIVCEFDGEARKPFLRNRIGWCVLHPMELAGLPATTQMPDGEARGEFPRLIAPWQPFFDMLSIAHPMRNGGAVTIRFSGDLFEMEDQRNWTDASYKTYSTPLRLPAPVEIRPGERVRQTVTIESQPARPAAQGATARAPLVIQVGAGATAMAPAIGLGAASHGEPLNEREIALLRALHLGHLRLALNLVDERWRERLARIAADAAALDAPLELEVIAGDAGEGLDALFREVAELQIPLARALVFPTTGYTTTKPVLDAALIAAERANIGAPIGGGSRAFFTELNRAASELPIGEMQIGGYPIDPQVHASDNTSVMETLRAQPETVQSARAILGAMPLAIGPVTLKMPFNPNAAGPAPELAPDALPQNVDARQASLFGAAWTVGSLGRLSRAGVDALTYYQTTGWRGVMERSDHPLRVEAFHSWPGMVFPLYHALADLAQFSGGDVLPVATSDPTRVDAAAARFEGQVRVTVANLIDAQVRVRVTLPIIGPAQVRRLDESTFARATTEPALFRSVWSMLAQAGGMLDLTLPPYAVA
ncbi:MAG: hypothetical protein IT337_10865, partial [Thermomicrobiales bacterium]|nr:hypothetical protein [Thermomicrobiales bacterium]